MNTRRQTIAMSADLTLPVISFNTGRGYTAAGQRIAAALLPNGAVLLTDVDRHIDYVTTDCDHRPESLTKDRVMVCYDYNHTVGAYATAAGLPSETYHALLADLRGIARGEVAA